MWLFCKDGFFSIVKDLNKPDCLLVRARFRGDIDKLVNRIADGETVYTILETPDCDYRFRISLPRSVVSIYVFDMTSKINYPNFKEMISKQENENRSVAYHQVWEEMKIAQERAHNYEIGEPENE